MPREREVEEDRDDVRDVRDDVEDKTKKPSTMLDDSDLEGEQDEGLDNAEARREQESARKRAVARDDVDDRDDEEEEDARLAYSDDEDDDYQPERLSRRRRRNRARKQRSQADQATIVALTEELATMRGHIDQVSRGQLGLAASDLDGQISQLQGQLEVIEQAQARAVKEGNDEEWAKARRLEREATQRLAVLGAERSRLVAFARQQQQPQGGGQRQPASNPAAARFAQRFMDRHDWFDPADAADEDSNLVKSIDATLVNEGYDPGTRRFWVELENRCRARRIGHYGDNEENDDMRDDDERDERPERRQRPARRDALPPRSRGSNRGGGAGGAGGFRLTPLMREALEAEGLDDEKNLTDGQRKYRARLVKTWKDGTEAASRAGGRR
jgi:hypothetical protein